jgi:hypothetical protein
MPAALAAGLTGRCAVPRRWSDPIVVVCATLAVMLIVIDGIGVNRGEVIRLWIFLGSFFQIPSAYVCARLNSRSAAMVLIATTLLQNALGSSMVGFIVPG